MFAIARNLRRSTSLHRLASTRTKVSSNPKTSLATWLALAGGAGLGYGAARNYADTYDFGGDESGLVPYVKQQFSGATGALATGGAPDPVMKLATTVGIVAAVIGASIMTLYRKCPPNKLLIVYGFGAKVLPGMSRGYRMVQGGGTVVLPMLQSVTMMPLDPFAIEIPLQDALSKEKVRVSVPSNFTIAIGINEAIANNAATRLLGLTMEDIQEQAREIITGQLRQVIATLTIEEINEDRAQFEAAVKEQCAKELNKIGLEMINVNITNIEDESKILFNLGKRKAAEVQSEAEISVQNARKKEAVGVETQRREQDISVAQQQRDREIGTRLAQQQSAVERAKLEALEVKGRNESQINIAESNALLQKAKADSYKIGETAEKVAEAAVVAAKAEADATAAVATAKRVEAEERARVEAPAIANKAKLVVDAEANAEVLRVIARGEADAIFAKADAEARGVRVVLEQKAHGLGELVERTGGPDYATRLLLLEELQGLAKTSADAISNVKMDKVVVWDNGTAKDTNGDPTSAVSNFVRSLTSIVPPAANVLQEVGGLDGLNKIMGGGLVDPVTDKKDKSDDESK